MCRMAVFLTMLLLFASPPARADWIPSVFSIKKDPVSISLTAANQPNRVNIVINQSYFVLPAPDAQGLTVFIPKIRKYRITVWRHAIVNIGAPGPDDLLRTELYRSVSDPQRYFYSGSSRANGPVFTDFEIRRNSFNLARVVDHRRKRALMFVFLMGNEKVDEEQSVYIDKDAGPKMHVLASRKLVSQQLNIKDSCFIDISVARYSDGYAPGEWNMVLPSGKPREVTVSWLWAF